jgi:hypothetical protein
MDFAERWTKVAGIGAGSHALFRAWWRARARPLGFALLAAALLAGQRGCAAKLAGRPEAAVQAALAARGLTCEPEDVVWIVGPRGLRGSLPRDAKALVRARRPTTGEPHDLFLVEVRVSPEGVVLGLGDAYDVTETSGVDESRPVVEAPFAAYTTSADGVTTGVHLLDLRGRAPSAYDDFTRVQRLQLALTNLQQTGQTAGVVHSTFALDPVAHRVALAWTEPSPVPLERDEAPAQLEAHADDHLIVLDPGEARVVTGGAYVRIVPDERARPGNLVTWSVDRVRAMPWFGDDRMQWIKAVAFTAIDAYRARFSPPTTAQDVQDELGLPTVAAEAPTFTDPEVGWPPAPIQGALSPPLPGEGQWIALDKDQFITPTAAGTAPAFVTSYVRPDVHRADVRVYVTLWDPRQIALHMEAGTTEPISASGEHGPGMVPRTPEVIKHLVAAFNGGFQAQHGEYGMQANGIEYLPPKPYAATVAELRDGSIAFGTWPGPEAPQARPRAEPSEATKDGAVPDDIVAFRQNLTALIEGGKFNPWGRNWWGGTPPGWPDQIHSARSAICLTRDGFVGYFYSASISAEDLALGMIDARCTYGIHLDMNPGHAGFEFYRTAPEGTLAALGRPLQSDWEAEGKVADMPGWVFRGRRMIKGMGHMLFPRYIQRESRDFFYLTSRPLLPGPPLAAGAEGETAWRTAGLPQHGFPYALAVASVHAERGGSLRVVKIDPRTVKAAAAAESDAGQEPTIVSLAAAPAGDTSLWWSGAGFAVGVSAPVKGAARVGAGWPTTAIQAASARAVAGVEDEDGMLVWVELPPESKPDAQSAAAMDELLSRMGCSERLALGGDARILLGGSLDAAGNPVAAPPPGAARFVRARAPDAHRFFEDTPLVDVEVWRPLQAKRVRYFYKPAPAASSSGSASSTPEAHAPATPPAAPRGTEASSIRVQSPR